jgi:hypothetical protein
MFKFEVEAQTISGLRNKIKDYLSSMGEETTLHEAKTRPVETESVEQETRSFKVLGTMAGKPPVKVNPDEVDSRGFKWHERIHASSRAKAPSTGQWRYRRNVDDNLIREIEGELQGKTKPQSVPAPVVPPVYAAPVPMATLPLVGPSEKLLEPVKVHAPLPLPPVTPGGHTFETFRANLVNVIASLINEKKIDQSYIKQLNEYFQVQELWQIFGDESKVRELFENFSASGLIVKVGQ